MAIGPNYFVERVDLTTAGTKEIQQEGGYFAFIEALSASGSLKLDALVQVQLAHGAGGRGDLPFRLGQTIVSTTRRYQISWEAQAGVIARFVVARDANVLQGDWRPNVLQVTSVIGTTVAQSAVTIGATEGTLIAANADRKSVLIKNTHATLSLFVGATGVLASDGFEVEPGQTLSLDKTTAAIIGISTGAGCTVRVLEES